MFQKMFDEAGALCFGSLMLTSNMNKAGVEDGFDRLRKQEAARKNRSTAGGMFCRKAYRHAPREPVSPISAWTVAWIPVSRL